jgi:DeoR family fructose operon transcriptional repressor
MKVSRSIVDNRRSRILEMLRHHESVKVNELAEQLNTSPLTIRRDLQALEKENLVMRFHGGASLMKDEGEENMFSSNLTLHKHAIAKEAAKFVEDGDTIFINTSSTALLILNYITAKQVTVITNNAKAIFSKIREDMMVFLIGGELRFPKESMVGDFAINNLSRVKASKCFLGCSGLTIEEGITTAVLQETAINELMLNRTTGERFILGDYQKIGRIHSFVSGSIDKISCLITDIYADQNVVSRLRERNIDVIQVKPLKRIE